MLLPLAPPEAEIVARVLALIALVPAEVRTRIFGADYRTRFPLAASDDGGDDDGDEEA